MYYIILVFDVHDIIGVGNYIIIIFYLEISHVNRQRYSNNLTQNPCRFLQRHTKQMAEATRPLLVSVKLRRRSKKMRRNFFVTFSKVNRLTFGVVDTQSINK